jgi:hypothetical protein
MTGRRAMRWARRVLPLVVWVAGLLSLVAGCGGGRASSARTWDHRLNCFASPGLCGYPDPVAADDGGAANVGVPAGTSQAKVVGPVTIVNCSGGIASVCSGSGTPADPYVIKGASITCTTQTPCVHILTNNVTIADSTITETGDTGGTCGTDGACMIVSISTFGGGTELSGTRILHDVIRATGTVAYAIAVAQPCPGGFTQTAAANCADIGYNEMIGGDGDIWTYGGGYIHDNYGLAYYGIRGDHVENIYADGTAVTAMFIVHNTLFNYASQVANIFADTRGGAHPNRDPCRSDESIDRNLLAGGNFTFYPCGNAATAGTSTIVVTDNHIARCLTRPIVALNGARACSGASHNGLDPPNIGYRTGGDSHGIYPFGGSGGTNAYTFCGATRWTGNVWDDNGSVIVCRSG